ncbi:hypothetical protein AB0I81_22895 [Nonomuraea sp. NPDC050404]|uniref:hypothetical protein n=1 Tax=Nonomuraea sp. NPDC050404 TaxID=3155783 RepID=UPI0033EAA60F
MPRSHGRSGYRWRKARATLMLEAPDVCWICGHSGGANEADHDPPLKQLEALGLDPCNPAYLRRAHGTWYRCPTCGRACNQSKGDRELPPPPRASRAW